jgi:transposase
VDEVGKEELICAKFSMPFSSGQIMAVKNVLGWELEIREKKDKGIVVEWNPPQGGAGRWIVERTFAWLNNCRRLSKDYEKWPENHEGVVYVAMIRLMLRRLDK